MQRRSDVLATLQVPISAAEEAERELAEVEAMDREAIAAWAEKGGKGAMPTADSTRREKLLRKLAEARATASAAQGAYAEEAQRYTKAADHYREARRTVLGAACDAQTARLPELRRKLLASQVAAELVLRELTALSAAVRINRQLDGAPEANALLVAIGEAASITNGEIAAPGIEAEPRLLAEAVAALAIPE